MKTFRFFAFIAFISRLCGQSSSPAITTGQYNSGRTASNASEVVLNPANVNVSQFGKLFSWSVDGWIFAQPLYVPGVRIGSATVNVVYVATMHNSVYAFNADNSSAPAIWHVSLGASVTAPTGNGCPSSGFTGPELGILSTPVIDQSTNTLYAVAAVPSGSGFVHYLHALDLATGSEKFGAPVQIQASVAGTGYDAQGGRVSLSAASTDVQRTSLLLANGTVYAGFGNCGPDNDPWHGWVVGYSAANVRNQVFAFNTTPNGGQGGIWQSGRGLVADTAGDIYFNTGNATAYTAGDSGVTTGNSGTDAAHGNYAMRFMQLTSAGQFVASYPPTNYADLNTNDLDLSSSGPLLIPGTNLLVAGGKDGVAYVFDSSNLASPQQTFQAAGDSACTYSFNGCDQIHDLAFWNSTLYVWGARDVLRAFTFNPATGRFNTTPASRNTIQSSYHPPAIAVSANSSQGGILWAVTSPAGSVPAMLRAFDATNVATELWNSNQNPDRDGLPTYPRFTEPTVANGRVYVATHSNQVAVYGLLGDFSLSSPPSESVDRGRSISFTLQVTAVGGFASPVSLSASGLPAGATAGFVPSSISGSGSSTVTIATSASTPTGTYSVLLNGIGGGVTRTASLSLVVTTPDVTPPALSCCSGTRNGSSYVLGLSASDSQSGLKTIQAASLVNATASIPAFTAGTTGPISFSETVHGWNSYVKFQLTDVAGNVSYIDPFFFDEALAPLGSGPFVVTDVTPAEGFLTIINGTPGLRRLRIRIGKGANRVVLQEPKLKDGEVRQIDITSSLPDSGASVTFMDVGRPGGTANIVLASGPVTPSQ